jgi:hypothetical protein
VLGRADGNAARRLLGATVGAFVAGAPALIVRWIEVGNPVFPAYNNIFRSPYWPPINDRLNFPYWHDPGLRGALTWMWEAVRNPSPMIEVTPPGGFGLLIGALFVGFAIGWRRSASRAAPLVWLALVLATTLWWVQFRYLRYLVPSFLVATALVLLQAGGRQLGRGATIVLATAAAALLALSLPATIATFWNVPQRKLPVAAAFGRWDARDYRRHVDTSVDALDAFQRAAPRGAKAMVSPEGALRVYADDRDLSPTWEVFFRLQADGPLPTGADEALRRMRAKGIGWVLMSDAELPRLGATYVPSLLAVHGEVVFADRGWTVYHLVDRPRVPPSLPPCDPRLVGRPACWVGMKPLDRHPGISGAEAPGGVFRTLAICGGQTVVVRPELAASGTPAQVTLDFDGRDPLLGLVNGGVAPGTATPVTGTAPRDAHHVAIRIIPGAGSLVRTIGVAVAGGCAD